MPQLAARLWSIGLNLEVGVQSILPWLKPPKTQNNKHMRMISNKTADATPAWATSHVDPFSAKSLPYRGARAPAPADVPPRRGLAIEGSVPHHFQQEGRPHGPRLKNIVASTPKIFHKNRQTDWSHGCYELKFDKLKLTQVLHRGSGIIADVSTEPFTSDWILEHNWSDAASPTPSSGKAGSRR